MLRAATKVIPTSSKVFPSAKDSNHAMSRADLETHVSWTGPSNKGGEPRKTEGDEEAAANPSEDCDGPKISKHDTVPSLSALSRYL